MNKRILIIAVIIAIAGVGAVLFSKGENLTGALKRDEATVCRTLKNLYDQGVLTQKGAAALKQAGRCAKKYPNIWYAAAAPAQPAPAQPAPADLPPLPEAGTSTAAFVARALRMGNQTYVKGQSGMQIFDFTVQNKTGRDGRIDQASVRFVADDDGNFDNAGYGDTAANTVIQSASLFAVSNNNGDEISLGQVGLSLFGTIGQSGGYYRALFTGFNVALRPDETVHFRVRADLSNVIPGARFIAADLLLPLPQGNIRALDADGNLAQVLEDPDNIADSLNSLGVHQPDVKHTILTRGTLTGAEDVSPDNTILLMQTAPATVARYKFSATHEAFTVQDLDVVLDSNGSFSDDPSDDSGGNAINRVGLSYPRQDGTTETRYAAMASGKASFTDLGLFVPRNDISFVTILAQINSADTVPTGITIRLGLSEQGSQNNAFEAVAFGSGETIRADQLGTYEGSQRVNYHTIRKTVPQVSAYQDGRYNNGVDNEIAKIRIGANIQEAVALKRLAFEFSSNTGMSVNELKFYRNIGGAVMSDITNQVSIRNRAGDDLETDGELLNTDTIFITWDNAPGDQEFITRGVTNTYSVRATISGGGIGRSLSTYIADDTRLINGTAQEIIDSGAHFVWSDNSNQAHSTATADWTNGTDVISLPTATQSFTF